MTVSATTDTRKQYTGNSGYTTSTDFTAAFKYLSTSEIKVTHTNTTSGTDTAYVEGTHYSVQSGASADSVTIRFLTSYVPTATTEYVTIFRETTFDQLTDYTEGSTLDAETLEQNFDKGIMLIQQVNNIMLLSMIQDQMMLEGLLLIQKLIHYKLNYIKHRYRIIQVLIMVDLHLQHQKTFKDN